MKNYYLPKERLAPDFSNKKKKHLLTILQPNCCLMCIKSQIKYNIIGYLKKKNCLSLSKKRFFNEFYNQWIKMIKWI